MTMLDRMRQHRGWLKWSLGLVVLTFIIFYIPDFLDQNRGVTAGAAPREVIAEVDGHKLTAGDFRQRLQNQIQAYRQQFGGSVNDQLLRQLGVDRQILGQMVDEELAVIEARRLGLAVSDEELAQQIFAIPALQESGHFIGERRYEQLLQAQNPPITKSAFEDGLRRNLLVDKLRATLTDWIAVSDEDVAREFRDRNEKVKLQVVSLTADEFRDKVSVTDADVQAYYDAHKAEFRVGEQRKIKYVVLDREEAGKKAAVTPAEIQAFYNENIQQYQTPEQVEASHILLKTEGKDEAAVRKEAEDVLKQAKAPGADFAALARKYSDDDSNKATGGQLGFFSRGRMVPEFEAAAFSMVPGQVSDLIKTQYGFHIIKVTAKKPASTEPLDAVRSQIEAQLAAQKANQQIEQRAQRLQGQIHTAADLESVAKASGLTVQESGFFQQQDPVPGLGTAPQVATAAFGLDKISVAGPIASPRGPVFLALADTRPPYVPKLDEVRERARQDAIRAKAAEVARERAASIAATLKSAKDFAAAARAQGLVVTDTDLVARGSNIPVIGVSPAVDKIAFALPQGGVSDPIAVPDGTAIIRVAERDDVTSAELQAQRDTFRAELLNERRSRFYTAYMTKIRTKAKIEVNAEVVQRAAASVL